MTEFYHYPMHLKATGVRPWLFGNRVNFTNLENIITAQQHQPAQAPSHKDCQIRSRQGQSP